MDTPPRRAILGIDAAWTAGQPSGVALIAQDGERWRCLALAPSYDSFCALPAAVDWTTRHRGGPPEPRGLMDACRQLLDGHLPDVVAVDMPLATKPITGRRKADNLISQHFSAYGCSVHSPTIVRPGAVGEAMTAGFGAMGFRLATHAPDPCTLPALIEVYPHPAIVRLLQLERRLPYKVARSGRYWRTETPRPTMAERIDRVLAAFDTLRAGLGRHIDNIAQPAFATPPRLSRLKPIEDALDALVCCWVGAEFLAGRAESYGDSTSAIWLPRAISLHH